MDLTTASPDDLAAWRRLVERVGARTIATWLSADALRAATLVDTEFATTVLESLRGDGITTNVEAAFPEVVALAVVVPVVTFLIFERWFLVPMPKGPIEAWFGY